MLKQKVWTWLIHIKLKTKLYLIECAQKSTIASPPPTRAHSPRVALAKATRTRVGYSSMVQLWNGQKWDAFVLKYTINTLVICSLVKVLSFLSSVSYNYFHYIIKLLKNIQIYYSLSPPFVPPPKWHVVIQFKFYFIWIQHFTYSGCLDNYTVYAWIIPYRV